jgi:hypothetical protein
MVSSSWLGFIAGVLALAAYPLYVRAIFCGTAKPNRATWWVLALVNLMLAMTYWASGGHDGFWIATAYVLGPLVVAILSVTRGEGVSWSKLDRGCLFAAAAAAAVWWVSGTAQASFALCIAAELAGLVPTIRKALLRPWTEDRAAWFLAAAASLLNVIGTQEWTSVQAAYAIYLLVTNSGIALLLIRRRVNSRGASGEQSRP